MRGRRPGDERAHLQNAHIFEDLDHAVSTIGECVPRYVPVEGQTRFFRMSKSISIFGKLRSQAPARLRTRRTTMRIGKQDAPFTAISTSDAASITVRGRDLCSELIGKIDFADYFFLLLMGKDARRQPALLRQRAAGGDRRTWTGSERAGGAHDLCRGARKRSRARWPRACSVRARSCSAARKSPAISCTIW